MLNISLPKDDMSSDNMVYIITIKLLCKKFFTVMNHKHLMF